MSGEPLRRMDRLNLIDAEFLRLVDGLAHFHIAGISVFESPPPLADGIEQLIAAKTDAELCWVARRSGGR